MPYAKRACSSCGRTWLPHNASDGDTCRGCLATSKSRPEPEWFIRQCQTCFKNFNTKVDSDRFCRDCFKQPKAKALPLTTDELALDAPFKQAVFDLETWGLDRGWGVLLMGCILVHGDGPTPKWYQFDLTESSGWPNKRSDDSELARKILDVLQDCDIIMAHNGLWFDRKYLNTIALKYGYPSLMKKLVDPVQKARNMYRIGANSLSAIADYLGLPESKMHVPMETWRVAVLDNDENAWNTLRERCQSDVRILNAVCRRMRGDFGIIDTQGSAWR